MSQQTEEGSEHAQLLQDTVYQSVIRSMALTSANSGFEDGIMSRLVCVLCPRKRQNGFLCFIMRHPSWRFCGRRVDNGDTREVHSFIPTGYKPSF